MAQRQNNFHIYTESELHSRAGMKGNRGLEATLPTLVGEGELETGNPVVNMCRDSLSDLGRALWLDSRGRGGMGSSYNHTVLP